METLNPRTLRFTTYDRDVANDDRIPTVSSTRDFTDSRLYSQEGGCDTCYPVTSHCTGHIGKMMLPSHHIRYVYRDRAKRLCGVICDVCCMPIDPSTPGTSFANKRLAMILSKFYDMKQCHCTGNRPVTGEKRLSSLAKMWRTYDHFERIGAVDALRTHFRLGERHEVLVNYVMVLPRKLLEQLPDTTDIMRAYRDVIEMNRRPDAEEMHNKRVDVLYEALEFSLEDKTGFIRQTVLTRRVPNSSRAVIISDPNLGICDVGVPGIAAKNLYTDIVVTNDNIWSIVETIQSSAASSVIYDRRRYKLVNNSVIVRITGCVTESVPYAHSRDIFCGRSKHKEIVERVLSKDTTYILEPDGTKITLLKYRTCCMFVTVNGVDPHIPSMRILLQAGCIVTAPIDYQNTLVHRNPVLSAGSMRMHYARIIPSPSNIYMSAEEKYKQRIRKQTAVLLGLDPTTAPSVAGVPDVVIGTKLAGSDNSTERYGITSSVPVVCESDTDNICCISLSPFSVTTYQGDFDGDEMNVYSLNHCNMDDIDLTLVGDLRKGTMGVNHDALYGLYCITHNMIQPQDVLAIPVSNSSITNMLLNLFDLEHTVKATLQFNNYFCDCMCIKENAEILRKEYAHLDTDRKIVSQFYADVARALCHVCDQCTMLFDRLDPSSTLEVIQSGCRPKESTHRSIYNSVGVTSYVLPDTTIISYIPSNYSEGVTEDEYIHLSFSNRAQAVNKAVSTAPEGDNMRQQCNYMGTLSVRGNMWYSRDDVIYEDITEASMLLSREEEAIHSPRTYTYIVDDNSRRLPYRSLDVLPPHILADRSRIVHLGQRKLLMSEIDFLTDYVRTKGYLIVYAGAAPGSHILTLLRLFRDVRFDLYDVAELSSILYDKLTNRPRDRLNLYRELMTPKIARERYRHLSNVLLISDIRTHNPTEKDIEENNALNNLLVLEMQPVACMLKFRLPYTDGTTELPEGELRLQCWSGEESTEVRLVAQRPYKQKQYSNRLHEEVMYHHNTIRPYEIEGAPISSILETSMRKICKHRYYDMYRETQIISKYVNVRGTSEQYVYDCINQDLGQNNPISR
jgi:DNA-directed RNA polymerase beta' subunit